MTQRQIFIGFIHLLLLGTLVASATPQALAAQPQEQVTILFQNKDKDKSKDKDKDKPKEKAPAQNFTNQDMGKQPRFIPKVPKQNPEPPQNDPPKDKKKG